MNPPLNAMAIRSKNISCAEMKKNFLAEMKKWKEKSRYAAKRTGEDNQFYSI